MDETHTRAAGIVKKKNTSRRRNAIGRTSRKSQLPSNEKNSESGQGNKSKKIKKKTPRTILNQHIILLHVFYINIKLIVLL